MWIVTMADKFEQIVFITNKLSELKEFKGSKAKYFSSAICHSRKQYKTIWIKGFGKCYLKKIVFELEDDDLKFALQDIDYLFDNFNYKQICKKLNISVRTYMRHINEKKYFLKKIRKLLNEADNRKED